jgi:TATA-box binding protein (TBP) (component of TFIID and TFIIIB)
MNTTLDLRRIALDNTNTIYCPQIFSAVTWRHHKIHGTLQIFSNGKLIHTGKPVSEEPRVHIRRYVRILQKQDHPVRLTSIRLVCMSATHKLSGKIDLCTIPGSSYEPELFNAAILKRDSCTLCVFRTGVVVITGLRHPDSAYPILLELELYCT